MTMLFVGVMALAVAAWAARLWVLAQRAEHLVVLRLEAGTFLLARQPEGRYLLVNNPLWVPVELARFQILAVVERFRAVRAARTARARPFRVRRAAVQLP